MLSRIVSIFDSLSFWLHKIGTIVFITALMLVIIVDVFLRYLFNAPLLWGKDLNGLLLLIVFFASIPYCWDAKNHIRMEILYMRFRGRFKSAADVVAALTGILFFGLLGIKSIEEIPYMIVTNETKEFLPLPIWPLSAFVALCSFVLCIKLFVFMIISFSDRQISGGQ